MQNEQYISNVKTLLLSYKCDWIHRMREFLDFIDTNCMKQNCEYFPVMLEALQGIMDNGQCVITHYLELMKTENFPDVSGKQEYNKAMRKRGWM